MICKYCDGEGEVRGFPRGYEDDGIEACPCCKGEGIVSKKHYREFMKDEQKVADWELLTESEGE